MALVAGIMAAGAGLFMAEPSNAQESSACLNNVFINSIYSGGGSPPFDYMVQVQNRSNKKRNVTVTGDGFGRHPDNWQMWYVDSLVLAPGAVATVKIGTGTKGDLSAGNTKFFYDKQADFRDPSVAVNKCSVAN